MGFFQIRFMNAKNIANIVCNFFFIIYFLIYHHRGGLNSVCQFGYEGPLCGSCLNGYAKLASSCLKCKDSTTNIFAFMGIFFALFISLILFVM